MLEHRQITYNKDGVEESFDFYQLWQTEVNEVQELVEKFNFPLDFITSGQDPYEVARWESYTNEEGEVYTLSIINYPFKQDTEDFRDVYRVSPMSIITKPGLVIVTSIDSLNTLDGMTDEQLNSFKNVDELALLLDLLWFVARLYIVLLKEIDQEIRSLEMDVTETTRNEIFYRMMKLNKALVFFNSGINNNRIVLENLKEQFSSLEVKDQDVRRLRDVNVELHQASGMVHELKQLNEKVADILSSVVNNNMNQIMKVLTVWSIILTIPTIITGTWGMNVPLPGEGLSHSITLISVITLVIMVAIFWLFKRNKWL